MSNISAVAERFDKALVERAVHVRDCSFCKTTGPKCQTWEGLNQTVRQAGKDMMAAYRAGMEAGQ